MGTIDPPPHLRPVPTGPSVRVDGLVALGAGIASALLPREPREDFAHRHGVDPTFWSPLLGLFELFAGGWTLVGDFLMRIRGLVDQNTDAAIAAGFEYGKIDPWSVMWGGAFAWLRWLTSPWTLFLLMATITGGVRLLSFAVTREAVGEPLAWLGWWLWRLGVQKPAAATHDTLHFGPARADRVLPQDDGGLLVLTRDPRADWNERVTIQVGERFFRLAEEGERREGGWHWHAYRLREEDPTAVIRALVLYEPPAQPL